MQRLLPAAVLLLLVATPWLAQSQPVAVPPQPVTVPPAVEAFTGTWTLVGAEGSPEAERRFITAEPGRIRIAMERERDDRMPVLVYKLDGSKSVNSFGSGSATTRLEGSADHLILETVYIVRDRPVTVTERLTLSSDSTEMTVERTVRVEHGYLGVAPSRDAAPPNVSQATVVFRKQP